MLLHHVKGETYENMMKKLTTFCTEEKDWIRSVGKCLFNVKKQDPDEYLRSLCKGDIPVDEVALFIFAKAYDVHIGVINGMQYWTTRKDTNFKKCTIKLIYVGKMYFIDTIDGELSPALSLELQVKIYKSGYCSTKISAKDLKEACDAVKASRQRGAHLQPLDDNALEQDNENNTDSDKNENNNGNATDREDLLSIAPSAVDYDARSTHSVDSFDTVILDQDDQDADQSPKKQVARKSGGGRSQMQRLYDLRELQKKEKARLAELRTKKKEEARKVIPVRTGLRSQGAPPQLESSSDSDSSHESDIQDITPGPAPVSMRLRSQDAVKTNQDEVTNKKKRKADNVQTKPPPKKQKPSKKAESEKTNDNGMALRSGNKKQSSQVSDTPPNKKKTSQKSGKLVVTPHFLKKYYKKKRDHVCSLCKEKFPNVRKLSIHMEDKHQGFRFKCSYCPEDFKSINGKLKHMRKKHSSSSKKYVCSVCSKGFVYKSELDEHMRAHRKSKIYRCTQKGCRKGFTTKRAQKQHMQVHTEETFKCELCDYVGATKGYLQQHLRVHNKDFKTHCGLVLPNPGNRSRHQDNCVRCQAIVKKKYVFKRAKR